MEQKTTKWKCPRCGDLLEKSPSTAKFFEKQSAAGRPITGTVTCTKCTASFPIEDVYSGRYDATEEDV